MPRPRHRSPVRLTPDFLLPRALLRLLAPLALALVAALAAPTLHAATTKEHQLKAAFLYNFAKFVEWPPEALAETDASPLVIAVLADEAFVQELVKAVQGRFVKKHPVEVRRISGDDELGGAHILFIGAGRESRLAGALRGSPGLLTVGESPEFARRDGIITFVLVDDQVRFAINQISGEASGLKLSAQLLKLALPSPPRP